ncbi:hypothetical protein OK074_8438 [Actinobacteria bacterium OK074]|nr:hypothetical protein OK074_8438 [Actinobacteria bacterium OK074]
MDAFLYIIPALIMCAALFMAYRVIRRWLQVRGAWNSGLTAQGRCLKTYTTTHSSSGNSHVHSTLHHVYQFVTRDGRSVRFEEAGGRPTIVEGDTVTIYYTAGHEVAATAHEPSPVKQGAATLGILTFLGVMVGFCVFFMLSVHGFAADDSFSGMP